MRIKKLKRELKKKEQLPYLITDLKNIEYLTGFKGTYARMIIDDKKSYFISDSRYEEYAKNILPKGVQFIIQKDDPNRLVKDIIDGADKKSLFLEEHALTLSVYLDLKKKLRGIKLVPGEDAVNILRMVKDEDEIEILKKAAQITDWCVDYIKGVLIPGITEWEVAMEIESFYKENGCRRTSFDSIVASAKGSSMPHYQTSMTKEIEDGDIILIDMGCEYEGYNSDLTRTFFLHSIDPYFENVYNIVKKAQEAACKAVKPGISTAKLDAVARDIIKAEGFGENFGHSLGHGFGLEVHELPAVKDEEFKLKKNMTITIEPGVYIPEKGGVRIEDMVLVTSDGSEILTKSTKEIIIL